MSTDAAIATALAFATLAAARYEREVRDGLITTQQARADQAAASRMLLELGRFYHLAHHTEMARGEIDSFIDRLLRPRSAT